MNCNLVTQFFATNDAVLGKRELPEGFDTLVTSSPENYCRTFSHSQ